MRISKEAYIKTIYITYISMMYMIHIHNEYISMNVRSTYLQCLNRATSFSVNQKF